MRSRYQRVRAIRVSMEATALNNLTDMDIAVAVLQAYLVCFTGSVNNFGKLV